MGSTTQETTQEESVDGSGVENLQKRGEKSGKTRVETLVRTRVETLGKTPERILQQFRNNPQLALADVAKAIGKSTSAVERACAKLVQQGLLKHVGPRKGGHWEVQK